MSAETSAQTQDAGLTHARDIMTEAVVSVNPDTPVPEIAKLLFDRRISAVPVVNSDGVPISMVSDGDLVGRGDRERLARSDWWLAVISGKQTLDGKFEARLQATGRTAIDIPRGFELSARVLAFPDGKPGDIGLFLIWGE